jgi:hypothetical protein
MLYAAAMLYAAVVLAAPGGVAVPPRLLACSASSAAATWSPAVSKRGPRWLAITSRPLSSPARLGDPPRWRAPSGGLFDEAMFAPTGGLPVTGSSIAAADPVVSTSSDHAAITVHLTAW